MNAHTAGARQLSELAAKLKAESRGDIRRQLLRNIRAAGKPLLADAQKSALETLPRRGGLNQVVASAKFSVRTSLSGTSARVRLQASEPHHIRSIDKGRVRHPTFGHDPWKTQAVTPGWWTTPMEAGSPKVRAAIIRTVDEISRKLT